MLIKTQILNLFVKRHYKPKDPDGKEKQAIAKMKKRFEKDVDVHIGSNDDGFYAATMD
jgi:hypothetical protein